MGKLMVYITHDPSVDEQLKQVLSELKIDHYSRFREALQVASSSKTLLDSELDRHNVTVAVIEQSRKGKLLEKLKEIQVDAPFASLRAFVVSVVDTI
jgi:hypothetical protein